MIAISAVDGVLRIYAEVRIPSAEAGQWDEARHGKLIEIIGDYIDAAETVDNAAKFPGRLSQLKGDLRNDLPLRRMANSRRETVGSE